MDGGRDGRTDLCVCKLCNVGPTCPAWLSELVCNAFVAHLVCCVIVKCCLSVTVVSTGEMVNTPIFVDDTKSYVTYDQRSVDDVDDYKPPYNVRRAPANYL